MNRSTANVRRLSKFRRGAVQGSPSPPYLWIAIAVIVFLAISQWYQQRQEDQQAAEKAKEVAAAKTEKTKKAATGKHEPEVKDTAKNTGKNGSTEEDEPPAKTNKKPVELAPSVTAKGSAGKELPKKVSSGTEKPAEPEPSGNPHAGKYRVTHVADGDTLNLEGKHRVRLIGIDCPEIAHPEKTPPTKAQPWSGEATKFTETRIKNQTVRIEFDPKYETEDDYGRWLCWVYYRDPRDGSEKLLNEELLRAGLAYAYDDRRKYHYSEAMYRRLKAAQREAQDEERGIYSK